MESCLHHGIFLREVTGAVSASNIFVTNSSADAFRIETYSDDVTIDDIFLDGNFFLFFYLVGI